MCVKNARFGSSCSTYSKACATVVCVGCGLWRSASKKQDIQTGQLLHGCVWNPAVIRQICRRPEAISVYERSPVVQQNGRELQAEQLDTFLVLRGCAESFGMLDSGFEFSKMYRKEH